MDIELKLYKEYEELAKVCSDLIGFDVEFKKSWYFDFDHAVKINQLERIAEYLRFKYKCPTSIHMNYTIAIKKPNGTI